MEENKDIISNMSTKQKLENFWYHYKWHTIVALFVLVVIIVTTLQMCQRTDYDALIMYAGDAQITNISEDGDLPLYQRILASLKRVTPDKNGDGTVDLNFNNLYVLTPDQLADMSPDKTTEISLAGTDRDTFESAIVTGDYYVMFLSEEIFLEKDAVYDGALFAPLEKYATDANISYEYASERGIYLRSLPFASFIELPEDTVVCLRALSEYSQVMDKKQSTKSFTTGEEIIKNILNYK